MLRRIDDIDDSDHECDSRGGPDIDLCSNCKDHADFCSVCGLSSCCGDSPFDTDFEFDMER